MVVQLCEYSKNRCIVHFKKSEFYGISIILEKAIFLKKVFYSISAYTWICIYTYDKI